MIESLARYTCDHCFMHRLVPMGVSPLGWSLYGPDKHRCAKCSDEVAGKVPAAPLMPRNRASWT